MTTPDLVPLIRATSVCFDGALLALLHGDKHAARDALHGSASRRVLVISLRDAVHEATAIPDEAMADRLALVSDMGRIGQLSDHLARRSVAEAVDTHLSASARLQVATLLDAGGTRLRRMAEGVVPGATPAHRRSSTALLEVADHACRDRNVTMKLCAGLAITLLQASGHAGRAMGPVAGPVMAQRLSS